MSSTVVWLRLPRAADAELARRGYLVTDAERIRAQRYQRPDDRARSLLAAGLLRATVGRLAHVDQQDVQVDRTCDTCGEQHGRPRVGHGLHASVTHAGAWIGVALGHAELGLDVEPVNAVPPDLAATVAAPGEPTHDLTRLWVAKEAALKATGRGLDVDPATVRLDAAATRVEEWPHGGPARIHPVDPDDEHVASLCVIDAHEPPTVEYA